MSDYYCNLYCVLFNFGVPLEDIFPPNDIHPTLKNLFYQAYIAVRASSSDVVSMLTNFKCDSYCESLINAEYLSHSELTLKDELKPGMLLWIIRYFLKMLPLPLFPEFSLNSFFKWKELAIKSKRNLHSSNYQLNTEIACSIKRLPKCNIMLIYYLMSFLRKLSELEESHPPKYKFQKRSQIALAQYFSSALFFPPFKGKSKAKARLYFVLTYYLIRNWTKIIHIRSDLMNYNIERILKKNVMNSNKSLSHLMDLPQISDYSLVSSDEDFYEITDLKDKSCQTISLLNCNENNTDGVKDKNSPSIHCQEDEKVKSKTVEEVEEANKTMNDDAYKTCLEVITEEEAMKNKIIEEKVSDKVVTKNSSTPSYAEIRESQSSAKYGNYNTFCKELFSGKKLKSSSEIDDIKDSKLKSSSEIDDIKDSTLSSSKICITSRNSAVITGNVPKVKKDESYLEISKGSAFLRQVITKLTAFKQFTTKKNKVPDSSKVKYTKL